MDFHDCIHAVVFTRQQHLRFNLPAEGLKFIERRAEFVVDFLAFARKFDEGLGVVELGGNFFIDVEGFFEAGSLLKSPGRSLLIAPESGIVDQCLQFIELALLVL